MAPELARFLGRLTFVLLTLAAMAMEIAAVDTRPVAESLGLASIWVGLALAFRFTVRWPLHPQENPPRWVLGVLVLLTLLSFVLEPLQRLYLGEGAPLEMLMVSALRNLGLGLAVFSGWLLCLRLAALVSLFLMLFSAAMTDHPAVLVLLGLYSAIGSIWLMLVYWSGLRRYFVTSDRAVTLHARPDELRLPWAMVSVSVLVLACLAAIMAIGPQTIAYRLGELLPTSGGTGAYDPFSRGGVNDGDDEIKGDNARSTGMTQTETFLESPLPSLYDLINDTYGEPFKPKEQERAIALDQTTQTRESEKPPADNLRPNREFPTTRRPPRNPRDPDSRSARALFEVQGRTPLHIRVVAYDWFDGLCWHEAPVVRRGCRLEKEPQSTWMKAVDCSQMSFLTGCEAHQFKITQQLGSLVPTPPYLRRFRVGRVDQADFFGWGQDHILRMSQRDTPPGIIIETDSQVFDGRSPKIWFPPPPNGELQDPLYHLPRSLDPQVRALAHQWGNNLERGWEQIEGIVQRLRTEYRHEHQARLPEEIRDPLQHFLLLSKCGPDYQFATATAILLRVLGYPTRIVSGFYVSPDHYDPLTRHTPVVESDLHFWAEVRLPSGDWLILESTPGYEVLLPAVPLSEQLLHLLTTILSWLLQHAILLTLTLLTVGVLYLRRFDLFDYLASWLLRRFPARCWRKQLRRVVRLLEWRGQCLGKGRRPAQTLSIWLRTTFGDRSGQGDLATLVRMAEWASYGGTIPPPWKIKEVFQICDHLILTWTLNRWRQALLGPAPPRSNT